MKRHRVAEWIKKYKTQQYAAWRDSFSFRDIHTHIHIHIHIHKEKGWKKTFHVNSNQKKSRGSNAYITMLPDSASGKDSTCQWRRHKRCAYDPWVRKMPWRRAWQPTSVFLPGETHGQGAWKATVHRVTQSQVLLHITKVT